jgi:hypothetical protein
MLEAENRRVGLLLCISGRVTLCFHQILEEFLY